jgi:hypothetical protein
MGYSLAWRLIEPEHSETGSYTENPGTIYYMKGLPAHVSGFIEFLSAPHEKANEDLAIAYFRHVYGETFTRQKEAKLADGYVPGHFVVELKGKQGDWFKGLLQGLAYRRVLDFDSVVVAAQSFLAVWHLEDVPDLVAAARAESGAPSEVCTRLAKRFASQHRATLEAATWRLAAENLPGGLYADAGAIAQAFRELEATLKAGKRIRQRITPSNFTTILLGLVPFFDEPMKAVRAFYSMIFNWQSGTSVVLSSRSATQATVGGEVITNLRAARRDAFKDYVEKYAVGVAPVDDFFARFDQALDVVNPQFRRQHGIFFTDLDLARFAMWYARRTLGDIGASYLVIDPACGSGNLVTNWRSPLELRHKVVSEIEPELLFAVERRMRGDTWHDGHFTVVPKVAEGTGLNFLDINAATYLQTLRGYLQECAQQPDRPLAFLCNPPYRNDDDQRTAKSIAYNIDESIVAAIGPDAARERYCCFLAQMKLVCDAAAASNLPGDSLLLVFTKLGWLANRDVLGKVKEYLFESLEPLGGLMVDGREFFDVKGAFPVGFTLWRYKTGCMTDVQHPVPLVDLTWVSKESLAAVPWNDTSLADTACEAVLADTRSVVVPFGASRTSMREWTGLTRFNFYRPRRKNEVDVTSHVGGLPAGDRRLVNKQAYGEDVGQHVGFMDDLTPVRLLRPPRGVNGMPWFRLDNPFMDYRKARCLSGSPDQKGFYPEPAVAGRVFFWYAAQKCFAEYGYPMWADPMDLWAPVVPLSLDANVRLLTYAIAFADNECLECEFPANNPIMGAPRIFVANPMSPNDVTSWWNKNAAPLFGGAAGVGGRTLTAVTELYAQWKTIFRAQRRLPWEAKKPYYVGGAGELSASSGLVQIKEYIDHKGDAALAAQYGNVQRAVKDAKHEFHRLLMAADGLDYFGAATAVAVPVGPVVVRKTYPVAAPAAVATTPLARKRAGKR